MSPRLLSWSLLPPLAVVAAACIWGFDAAQLDDARDATYVLTGVLWPVVVALCLLVAGADLVAAVQGTAWLVLFSVALVGAPVAGVLAYNGQGFGAAVLAVSGGLWFLAALVFAFALDADDPYPGG